MRAPDRLPSRSAATTNGTRRQRVVVGDPRPGAVAQLELARAPPPGEAVGEPGEQRRPGVVGVDGVGVEAARRPAGRCRRPARAPGRRPGGRRGRRARARTRARRAARGRRAAGRGDRAGRRARRRPRRRRTTGASGRPATIRASRGCTGSPTIARPSGVMAPARVERAELVQQLDRLLPRLAPAAGRRTPAARLACPTRPARARARPRSTWVISAARWAGRVPCSIRLHSR